MRQQCSKSKVKPESINIQGAGLMPGGPELKEETVHRENQYGNPTSQGVQGMCMPGKLQ